MTLYDYIITHPEIDEFAIHDTDYDIESYFYQPEYSEDWDKAMNIIAQKLQVIDAEENQVTVNLSQRIESAEFTDLFIDNNIDAIMDDIMNILSGGVSESWLIEFSKQL